jgi:glutamine amidotransferase
MDVVVIDTGCANLASMLAGLRRAGASPRTSVSPSEIAKAARVVLPGVGAFAAGIERLRELSLIELLALRVRRGEALLAVCLGLQLLCKSSEESPGVEGLGVLPVSVARFGGSVTVPQLGWNHVTPRAGCALLDAGYAYFANSYRIDVVPAGWRGAASVHGEPFVAAIERGAVLGCQFHPELSGGWGQALMRRWLEGRASC